MTLRHTGSIHLNMMVGSQIICYQKLPIPVMTSNLCDTDDTVFSDLVPGCQSPIHPPTTMTDIMNEKGLQCTREYLLSYPVTSSDQQSGK